MPFQRNNRRSAAAALIAAIFAASPALAHEFSVTFVVPPGAEQSATQAFLLASAERDAHANETSEGHLGGVDSQFQIVTMGADLPASDVVVALGSAELPLLENAPNVWQFQVTELGTAASEAFLEPDESGFAARYEALHLQAPDQIATLAYVAARMIDLAVRAQDGLDDIAALQSSVADF